MINDKINWCSLTREERRRGCCCECKSRFQFSSWSRTMLIINTAQCCCTILIINICFPTIYFCPTGRGKKNPRNSEYSWSRLFGRIACTGSTPQTKKLPRGRRTRKTVLRCILLLGTGIEYATETDIHPNLGWEQNYAPPTEINPVPMVISTT